MKSFIKHAGFVITSLVLLPSSFVLAADQPYVLISGYIPFVSDVSSGSGLAGYLNAFFKLGIGIAVILAVLLFVVNGITYMTSDAIGGKETAKNNFISIVTGLILIFGSVIILRTINPNLVDFKIFSTLENVGEILGGGDGGGGTTDPAQEAAVRTELESHNITINNPPCQEGQTSGCTNVGDLPRVAIDGLISLASDCGCALVVTGGTEAGQHVTHGPGQPMVDIRRSGPITPFIQENGALVNSNCHGGPLYSYAGSEFWDEPSDNPHWHSCFGTQCRFSPECPRL